MTDVVLTDHAAEKDLVEAEEVEELLEEDKGRWIHDKQTNKLMIAIDTIVIVLTRDPNAWVVITAYVNDGEHWNLESGRYTEVNAGGQ